MEALPQLHKEASGATPGACPSPLRCLDMFVHIPIAIGIQLACCLIGRPLRASIVPCLWIGWFAGSAVCVMREITQREYQWIEAYGHGLRANMPGYEGLKVWEWNAHSISETVVAMIAAAIVAAVGTWWAREG